MHQVSRDKPADVPPRDRGSMDGRSHWTIYGIYLVLALMVFAVFGRTVRYEFINFDDNLFIYENPMVTKGLTWEGFLWAFQFRPATSTRSDFWHPLDFLSHMLDCQLFGLKAGGHHFTNVLVQAIVAILLFRVLRKMTGALWRSAFVAAVFAIHPLRVESVAWVTERKDVLQGLFFMLTLGAYYRYVRNPQSWPRYLMVILFFVLGLMCKPTLMTLPFVLLILDYWPLGRYPTAVGNSNREGSFEWKLYGSMFLRLVVEKIPLIILATASCIEAALENRTSFVIGNRFPQSLQIANAFVSYVGYIGQMIYPAKLAFVYPFPKDGLPTGEVMGAVALLLVISIGVVCLRRRQPWLLVGWLWYLIMLAPMAGFVQAGLIARADRYTYLPQIGLIMLLTWLAADISIRAQIRRWMLAGTAGIVIGVLIVCASRQTRYWKNNETLWTRSLACTVNNAIAHNNLGSAMLLNGQRDEAIAHFRKAIEIQPDKADAYCNLGNGLCRKGQLDEAIACYQKAIVLRPDLEGPYNNLGLVLLEKGQMNEAVGIFQKAILINPKFAGSYNNLGYALLHARRVDEAICQFQKALEIQPDYINARANLGVSYSQIGKHEMAVAEYRKALKLQPSDITLRNNLGNALLAGMKTTEAIEEFHRILQIQPGNVQAHNSLGEACLQNGQVHKAIAHYQKSLDIQPDSADVCNNLAWLLATWPEASVRNGVKAVVLAERAVRLTDHMDPIIIGTLAAAYAEAGRFEVAVATARQSLRLVNIKSNPDLAEILRNQIRLYQAGLPYHDTSQTNHSNNSK